MAKLLVNAPTGEQQLIEVGIGGGYFDESLIIWDERADGAITEALEIGSMVREGDDLIKLPEMLPDHKKWLDEKPLPKPLPTTLKDLIEILKEKGIV